MNKQSEMLKWEAFEKWLSEEYETEEFPVVSSTLERLKRAVNANDEKEVREAVTVVISHLVAIESLWEDFQSSLGMTGRLWSMYIEMVLILKRFIHAERAG